MKKALSIFIILILNICLTACSYNPPEGWTKKHHNYEEVLEFAKSIDPNATVIEKYTDTVNEYGWEFREWDAVINGIDCHVSSVSDWVWNEGFGAGEFVKVYYRIDTDYDYTVIKNIVSEEYSEWKCGESLSDKYHSNTIYLHLTMPEFRMLNDDELEQVWQIACEINEKYEKLSVAKKIGFAIPSPAEYCNPDGEQEYFVRKDSHTYITDFTEEGKNTFLQEYREDWALLESGLPVY